jgi:hypothetical protein
LRQEYARRFLDYEDTGAHRAYIGILQRVRASSVAASSVAPSVLAAYQCSAYQCSAYQCSAYQCSAYQCSAYQCSAYRRTAYNRWMMDSAYFSDFKRVVGLRSVAGGNL